MAVAKRRQSKARRDMRRSQWMKMDPPAVSKCPHCGEVRLSHRACSSCGWYGSQSEGRVVVPQKENEKNA